MIKAKRLRNFIKLQNSYFSIILYLIKKEPKKKNKEKKTQRKPEILGTKKITKGFVSFQTLLGEREIH